MAANSVGLFCFIWTNHFSISWWEKPKTLYFHDLGIFARVHESQSQLFLSLEKPGYLTWSKKIRKHFNEILFLERSTLWKSTILISWEKTGTDNSRRSVLKMLEPLEYRINIFQKEWNRKSVILESPARVVCIFHLGGLHLPLTPQHTDSHPCDRPPSWMTRANLGTRVVGDFHVFRNF